MGSFGKGDVSRSLLVGFRRIELAMRTVRLVDFTLDILPPLLIESVEGVCRRSADSSDGAEAEVLSAMLSGMAGVWTGIGRSIDSRDPTSIGMGTLSDSLSGLIGQSYDCDRCEKVLNEAGLTGDSVRLYRGGCMNGDI